MTSASTQPPPVLVWFRRDLRLEDNPAFHHAAAAGGPVIPCFVWAPEEEAPWEPGAASRWWLHHSLAALADALEARGLKLVIRRGPTRKALLKLAEETGAGAIHWNRLYEPGLVERDTGIKQALNKAGLDAHSFAAHLLHEPWTVLNQQDKPYQVFTPFHRAVQELGDPDAPLPAPKAPVAPAAWPASESLASLELLPRIPWDEGFHRVWTPGENAAREALDDFAGSRAAAYKDRRDFPAEPATSRLSPALHFGEISPRRIWAVCRKVRGAEPYLRQLVWREFAHHLLHHFPHTAEQPLRPEFRHFPWRDDAKDLRAWTRGRTGYPLVDAGMRELWATGWMHNRVRMVVASFLVKDLRLSWTEGARWFWDTLVDADLANNTLGWQWAAGCGADAAPYFRVFNPDLQAAKFDPDGDYIRRWIPGLKDVPTALLHKADKLAGAVAEYPLPMIDHAQARDLALEAFEQIKNRKATPAN